MKVAAQQAITDGHNQYSYTYGIPPLREAIAKKAARVNGIEGIDPEDIVPALRRHLDRAGFPMVKVTAAKDGFFAATRLEPDHPWVKWTVQSLEKTSGQRTAAWNSGAVTGKIIERVANLLELPARLDLPTQPFPLLAKMGYGYVNTPFRGGR